MSECVCGGGGGQRHNLVVSDISYLAMYRHVDVFPCTDAFVKDGR